MIGSSSMPYGIAEHRPAGLGLPHVIDHRHAAAEHRVLQPVPRLRVEHFAGADDALEPRVVDVAERVLAVAHQHAHGGRRREDAGDAELLDAARQLASGVRVVERALEHDRRAAGDQRRVDHVAVADDPADVRGRPPDVVRLQPEAPAAHAGDVDLIAAVRVDRQLGLGGRARGGQDERRLVGLHRARCRAVTGPSPRLEERRPSVRSRPSCQSAAGSRRALQHDDVLDRMSPTSASASSTIGLSGTSLPLR